jgi:hypothetical protein
MGKEGDMTAPGSGKPNPALKALEVLAGDWEMELSHASFLPTLSDTVQGKVSFAWWGDGAYLVLCLGDPPPSPPAALWLMSRDESRPQYTVLYYDSRSVSRIYDMTFSDGIWRMWRDAPGFCQRFEGTLSQDGNMITAQWEKSADGITWEHDFDLTYTRMR